MKTIHKVAIPTGIIVCAGALLLALNQNIYKVNGDTIKSDERTLAIERIQGLNYLTDSQEISYINSISNADTSLQLNAIVQAALNSNNQAKSLLENDLKQEERLAKEKAEAERIAAEKAEAERIAAEKAEAERIAVEERIAAEKAEAERIAVENAERIAAEQALASASMASMATNQTSTMEYTLSQFMSIGRLNWGGYQYTYYSQSVKCA